MSVSGAGKVWEPRHGHEGGATGGTREGCGEDGRDQVIISNDYLKIVCEICSVKLSCDLFYIYFIYAEGTGGMG